MSSLRPRVIPCLQFTRGELLKTRRFKDPQYLGDPINAVKLFNDLECDELVAVDIRATLEARGPDYAMIEEFASEAFMPLAYGGGISSIEQIRRKLWEKRQRGYRAMGYRVGVDASYGQASMEDAEVPGPSEQLFIGQEAAAGVANGCKPPKPSGTTRFTACPVSRSIARIDNSSTGATIVIAFP